MKKDINITDMAVSFVETFQYEDIPQEALETARRCIVDTVGLYIAGTSEDVVKILAREALDEGGNPEALLLMGGGRKVPGSKAARVMGTAGHAHDWDDTQVSHDPDHHYGLLTHPSVPPLTGALVAAQAEGVTSGRAIMTAFLAGFEVETKVSEWMQADHYLRGHHSSGTVGTLGACVAAAKIMGLKGDSLRHAIGMAASFAAGIRCNFGTMTKPLHVGRAAENGVTAARLAARGVTADPTALDGRWGLPTVMSGGVSADKAAAGFANPLSIVSPGVSIKPYPSGIVTHQSMDALLELVKEHDVDPAKVTSIDFFAGSNILNPIRYAVAKNHLQAKFSMAALLSMIVLYRQAGRQQFTDEVVAGDAMQDMQARVHTHLDRHIESIGFDKIRSRIELTLEDGQVLVKEADDRYRGGPAKPMSDDDLADKFRACTAGLIDPSTQAAILAQTQRIDESEDVSALLSEVMGSVSSVA
ncbi:MmgE/PrpD family protein [Halomonas faecis]|uniref:MmgE/PrpD family protein n=1 Tax=Halomonas faecis TaxID=1562110 RepID=UPI0013D1A298|nr:MmgE/PrpD family protein [Halomonas faecis]